MKISIIKAQGKSSQIVGIFCYLSKAFNHVNDDTVLDKLLYYGIHDAAVLWFKSYLKNRRRRFEIWHNKLGKTFSNWETIKN
jgi:hypothetical protein